MKRKKEYEYKFGYKGDFAFVELADKTRVIFHIKEHTLSIGYNMKLIEDSIKKSDDGLVYVHWTEVELRALITALKEVLDTKVNKDEIPNMDKESNK